MFSSVGFEKGYVERGLVTQCSMSTMFSPRLGRHSLLPPGYLPILQFFPFLQDEICSGKEFHQQPTLEGFQFHTQGNPIVLTTVLIHF